MKETYYILMWLNLIGFQIFVSLDKILNDLFCFIFSLLFLAMYWRESQNEIERMRRKLEGEK